jgi:hypothetical protein
MSQSVSTKKLLSNCRRVGKQAEAAGSFKTTTKEIKRFIASGQV